MNQPISRQIRVFISSTFRDMQGERDYLVKFIFPQLRKLSESRGVVWSEVDLRWGITDEQSAEGQVLPICLAEIERCRPYFIGLLGERYGWIPDEIDPELVAQEQWLEEHKGHSVTELEILHGVLNDLEMADKTLFYFRDPSYLETLDRYQLDDFIEVPWRGEIEKYGIVEAQQRVESRKHRLAALKESIRRSGLFLKENYQDPEELGQWVLEDMTAIIERIFPQGSQPDPLQQEALLHEAFARSRMGVYIGGEKYFQALDRHIHESRQPLAVVGDSGSGKSALLANWGMRYRKANPDELVILHFVGATAGSLDWEVMLRRILVLLQARFDIQEEIPEGPEKLRECFSNWLHMASSKGKCTLILDAINKLEDRQGAQELAWLPLVLPTNIKIFLSTLPGKALAAVHEREWPTLTVELLNLAERAEFINQYLAQYSKKLSPERVNRLIIEPLFSNPLAVRILLEELRQFGVHEKLDQFIDHYLMADSISKLFSLVLERCEEDFEQDRPYLVRDVMSYIWSARRGLSETELMDLLGSDGAPLPHRIWSPLFLSLEGCFMAQDGLLSFFHDYIRQAVENKYLTTDSAKKEAHLGLANYFEKMEDNQPRKIEELPWQLSQASNWERLYYLLSDLPFFSIAWQKDEFDCRSYWTKIEQASPLRLRDGYQEIINFPQNYDEHFVEIIAFLLKDFNYLREALSLMDYLANYYRNSNKTIELAGCLGNLAQILKEMGNSEKALSFHKQQEQLCRAKGDQRVLQHALMGQANILYDRHDMTCALELFKEQEHICREGGFQKFLATSLMNQGTVNKFLGYMNTAMRQYEEAKQIYIDLGDKAGLSAILGNQAIILNDWGAFDKALEYAKEQEMISKELGDLSTMKNALGNQGHIYESLGDTNKVVEMFTRLESICRQSEDWNKLEQSLANLEKIWQSERNFEKAFAYNQERESICIQHGMSRNLVSVYVKRSVLYDLMSDMKSAESFLIRARQIAQQTNDMYDLIVTLGMLATFAADRKNIDEAFALYQEQEKLCRNQRNLYQLQYCLGQQAGLHNLKGQLDKAIQLLSEREKICRETNQLNGLQSTLGSFGIILKNLGRTEQAFGCFVEQEQICRKIGNRDGLQCALGDQANILFQQGKHEESLQLHAEEEVICREINNRKGLQGALGNKAAVLLTTGKVHEAMALFQEKEKICRDIKEEYGLVSALANQGTVYAQYFHDPEKARARYRDAIQIANNAGFTARAQQVAQLLNQI